MVDTVKFQFVPKGGGDPVWASAEVSKDIPLQDFLSQAEGEYGHILSAEVGRPLSEEPGRVAADIGRGALKLAKMGLDAAAWTGTAAGNIDPPLSVPDFPEAIFPTPKLENRGRQVLRGGLEGLGGGMGGGVRSAVAGLTSGLGAEVGQEHGGPVGALAGGLLGGGVGMAAQNPFTNTKYLSQEMLQGIPEGSLDFAKELMRRAREQGGKLLPNQAMPNATRLDDMAELLSQTHNGRETQNLLQSQPGWVQHRGQLEVSKLPGQVLPAQVAEDALAGAADQRIRLQNSRATQAFGNSLASETGAAKTAAQQILERALAAQNGAKFAGQTAQLWNGEDQQAALRQLTDLFKKQQTPGVALGGQGGASSRGVLVSPSQVGQTADAGLLSAQTARDLAQGKGQIVLPSSATNPEGANAAAALQPKIVPKTPLEVPDKGDLVSQAEHNLRYAGHVEVPRLQALDARLAAYAEEHSNQPAVQAMVGQVRNSLRDPSATSGWVTEPDKLKAGFDAAMKGEGASTIGTQTPAKVANRHYKQLDDMWKATVATEGTPLANASEAYKAVKEVSTQLKGSVVGRLAGRNGLAPDAEAQIGAKLQAVFSGKGDVAGATEIRQLQNELSQVEGGNEAFVNAAKTHLANMMQKAVVQGSARAGETNATNLYRSLAGTQAQRNALNATLEAMATAAGRDATGVREVKTGFNNFLQLVGAQAERPNRITSFPASEAERIAGHSTVAGTLRAIGNPFARAGLGLQGKVSSRTMKQMDAIFSSPDAIEQLQALAKVPLMSRKAQVIMGSLMGDVASQSGAQPVTE